MQLRGIPCGLTGLAMMIMIHPIEAADTHGDGHDHDIPEIVVTADPLSNGDAHFIAPTTVLTGRDLDHESMRSIGETVGQQLGVSSSDFGASVGRPVIRGLGGARVRVLENGIGSMDVSSLSADHAVTTEPLFAEQIEILRGPATLLYGSGASGGLVNVANARIPVEMPDAPELQLTGHFGTAADEWLGAFRLDAPAGKHIALHFDGLIRDNDDVDIPGFASRFPDPDERYGILTNSSAEAKNAAGGATFFGENGHIGIAVAQYDNEYGVPGVHHDHDGPEVPGGPRIEQRQSRYDVAAEYHLHRFMVEQTRVRFGWNNYEHDEVEPGGEVGTRFSNDEMEGRVEFLLKPVGRFDGVIGFQFRDKDFKAIGEEAFVPPSTLDSQAVFLFEKADYGKLHIDLGIRLEQQDTDSDAFAQSPDHNLISVSTGAFWRVAVEHEIGFSASRSQRAPTIEELFSDGPHLATGTYEIGDVNLGEETSYNVDVFWRGTFVEWGFTLNLFANVIDDFTYLRSNDRNNDGIADRVEDDFAETGEIVDDDDALLLVNQDQRDARFWGIEFESDRMVFDDHRGRLDLRLWTDYVEGEFSGGASVPRMPPLRFGGSLDWELEGVTARLAVVRVTEQDDNARLETPTDAYTDLNVQVGYTIPAGGVEAYVFARGTNLLNETQRRSVSFVKDRAPRPGIGGLFGVRIRY